MEQHGQALWLVCIHPLPTRAHRFSACVALAQDLKQTCCWLQDIVVQSARPYGQRAVLKFAQYTGAKALAGRHTPGRSSLQALPACWVAHADCCARLHPFEHVMSMPA